MSPGAIAEAPIGLIKNASIRHWEACPPLKGRHPVLGESFTANGTVITLRRHLRAVGLHAGAVDLGAGAQRLDGVSEALGAGLEQFQRQGRIAGELPVDVARASLDAKGVIAGAGSPV